MKSLNKPQKPNVSKLKKKADKYFSTYIRYRDGQKFIGKDGEEWYTQCITCEEWKPMKQMHAGHFQSRRYLSTRYDEFNVNGQCPKCNTFNAGEQYKYSKAIDKKYGSGVAEQLAIIAQQVKKLKAWDYERIIEDAKKEIKFYETL